MKLTDLLRRRSELASQSSALAATASAVSKELEQVDAELFARMKNLVVAIEGPEDAHHAAGSLQVATVQLERPAGMAFSGFFGDPASSNKPATPRTSKMEPYIVGVLTDAGRSLTRNEIFDLMMAKGIVVPGKDPKANLSAHLSYAASIVRDSDGRWALKQKEIA